MGDYLKKILYQIGEFVKGLTPAKKVAMFATGVGLFAGMAALFIWAGQKSYKPLFTNLSPEDSTNIMRVLREKNVPYSVDPSGRNIEVPPESLHELRLTLAAMGMPQTSIVGYEIFDKQSLGVTSFVQKMNSKRALEGELMRTIGTIRGVKRSRIHLAIPQKSTFIEDQKRPSASVVLDLEPGVVLSEKQIYGMGILVSRAVEGMDTEDVVIVDSSGKMLSKTARDSQVAISANQIEFQHKIEEELEKRVEAMLTPVVGEGKVVARVSAELDFNKVEENQTTYDQDGSAILSTQKDTTGSNSTNGMVTPPPGAGSNLPGQAAQPGGRQAKVDTNRSNERTNYLVPQTVRKTIKPFGSVQKLSVAIVLDGKLVKTEVDGKVLSKVEPWPPAKLKEFEQLASNALGLNLKRGDVLEVKNMEFTRVDFEEAQSSMEAADRRAYIQGLAVYAVVGLLIVLFFLFVVRPFIKWVTENTIDSVDSFLPQTIEELERLQRGTPSLAAIEDTAPLLPDKIDPEKVEGEMIKEKIITLVDNNPHKASLVLRDWIKGNSKAAVPTDSKSKSA